MRFIVDNNASPVGTSLAGYVMTTFDRLRGAFGPPDTGSDKTTAEWRLRFENGMVVTIYDYKEDSTPLYMYDWHIGSPKAFQDEAVKAVHAALGLE